MASRSTLLSERVSGPPTDIASALALLQRQLHPPAWHIPNLPSVVDALGNRTSPPRSSSPYEHVYNTPTQRSTSPQSVQQRRQPPSACVSLGPSSAAAGHTPRGPVSSRPVSRATTPRGGLRAGAHASPHTRTARSHRAGEESRHRLLAHDDAPARADGAVGVVSTSERTRCRNDVSKKLIDLYDELDELCECREKMSHQVAEAMCVDPRRAKEVRGSVSVLAAPPAEQQKALDLFLQALEDARAASVELVAAYLTPEEKRFLGINTHLFQTREERATTYQYAPQRKRSSPRKKQAAPLDNRGALVSSPSSTEASAVSSRCDKPSAAHSATSSQSSRGKAAASSTHSSTHSRHTDATEMDENAPRQSHTSAASSISTHRSSKHSSEALPSAAPSHTSKASSRSSAPATSKPPTPAASSGDRGGAAQPVEPPTSAAPAAGRSNFSTPGVPSPSGGQWSVEEPRSPALTPAVPNSGTTSAEVTSAPSQLAPLRFNIKQFAVASSTSTSNSEKNLTPERSYQPKLSMSTLGGSFGDSPASPQQPVQAQTSAAAPAASSTVPWTVSAASTGAAVPPSVIDPSNGSAPSGVIGTPPPLPSAPKLSTSTRPEFKRFVIDSDSDSSAM